MNRAETIALALGWIGTGCWLVCFWWMHRISARQNAMLKELHEMTKRIEHASAAEHDLVRELHPSVEKIKEQVEDVVNVVGSDEPRNGRSN